MLQLTPRFAPPPGSIGVGELQVDVATREIWLGVADTTDPAQAILVSDIVGLGNAIDDLQSYFDQELAEGLATKANTSHTHTASQITDFADAVRGVVGPSAGIPPGCIIIYKGSLGDIGSGAYAGYVLCDGQNGTPDLRSKFVMGAGAEGVPAGTTGGAKDINGSTTTAGSHNHGGITAPHAITLAQMPYHNHTAGDQGHGHPASGGSHNHSYRRPLYATGNIFAGGSPGLFSNNYDTVNTGSDAGGVSVGVGYASIVIGYAGSNEGHAHGVYPDGTHAHTLNIINGNLPPYVALGFIMKL